MAEKFIDWEAAFHLVTTEHRATMIVNDENAALRQQLTTVGSELAALRQVAGVPPEVSTEQFIQMLRESEDARRSAEAAKAAEEGEADAKPPTRKRTKS